MRYHHICVFIIQPHNNDTVNLYYETRILIIIFFDVLIGKDVKAFKKFLSFLKLGVKIIMSLLKNYFKIHVFFLLIKIIAKNE